MAEAADLWTYQARLDETRTGVVDGDTLDLTVDVGFRASRRVRVRLQGVDTAEIYGVRKDSDEYQLGLEHKQFVADWLADADAAHDGHWPLIVSTHKTTGKYGRWRGEVVRKDTGEELAAALYEAFGDEILDDGGGDPAAAAGEAGHP